MTDNQKLVRYFVSSFLDNSARSINNVVSPTFAYTLNLGEKREFEVFIKRMRLLNSSSKLTIGEISSPDDKHFHYDFELNVATKEEDHIAYGSVQIVVIHNLIQQVDINYHKSKEEFDDLQKMMEVSTISYI